MSLRYGWPPKRGTSVGLAISKYFTIAAVPFERWGICVTQILRDFFFFIFAIISIVCSLGILSNDI